MTKDIKVCKLCQSICDSYKVHFKAKHKPVKCEKCKKIFEGKRRLKNHQKTHQQQRCVKCRMLIVGNDFTKHKRNCNPVPTPSPIEDHVYQALKSSQDPSHDHAYCWTVSPGMRIEPFKSAMAKAPCIIFIDKINHVGAKRTSSSLHPYANQTINQLLSEMDGSNKGVIVLGATNREEDLDEALLQPGRFDTKVQVSNPNIKGRKKILQLYLNKIKHDNTVKVDNLASRTTGFSGADLENLVNMASIRASIEGREVVGMAEFEYSYDKITMGVEWKSRVRGREDMEITAYHEAGHTLVNHFTKGSNTLHKVTILAKGGSGGHTAFVPSANAEWHQTKEQLIAQMDTAMGGRAAEELIFGKDKITGGASSDLQSASNVSEVMVKKLGMSDKVGLRIYNDNERDQQSSTSKEVRTRYWGLSIFYILSFR